MEFQGPSMQGSKDGEGIKVWQKDRMTDKLKQ